MTRVAVHYRAVVDGETRDAVATRIAGVDLAERIGRRSYAELARKAQARSPAPARVDPELGALVTWLPFDPRLPALAEGRGELERRLGMALGAEPVLVGYKPRARAVLRANGLVLKAYGAARQFEAALAGLRAATAGPLRTGAFAGRLAGAAADGAAGRRGPPRRRRRPRWRARPARWSSSSRARASTASRRRRPSATWPPRRARRSSSRRCCPACARAWRRCSSDSAASCPPASRSCPRTATSTSTSCWSGTTLAVVDFDEMCLAAPALDLATYAADVVRGRDADLDAVAEVLDGLLDGYGERPQALDWHLCRGDPRPRRAPVPPPVPRLARPGRRDAARGGDGSCLGRW